MNIVLSLLSISSVKPVGGRRGRSCQRIPFYDRGVNLRDKLSVYRNRLFLCFPAKILPSFCILHFSPYGSGEADAAVFPCAILRSHGLVILTILGSEQSVSMRDHSLLWTILTPDKSAANPEQARPKIIPQCLSKSLDEALPGDGDRSRPPSRFDSCRALALVGGGGCRKQAAREALRGVRAGSEDPDHCPHALNTPYLAPSLLFRVPYPFSVELVVDAFDRQQSLELEMGLCVMIFIHLMSYPSCFWVFLSFRLSPCAPICVKTKAPNWHEGKLCAHTKSHTGPCVCSQIKESTAYNAGLGLFTKYAIAKGTVLGSYPGRKWPQTLWLNCKAGGEKEAQRRARTYVWLTVRNWFPYFCL